MFKDFVRPIVVGSVTWKLNRAAALIGCFTIMYGLYAVLFGNTIQTEEFKVHILPLQGTRRTVQQ